MSRNKERKGNVDMLSGDVNKTIMRLTGPMILAMMAMVAFNLIDTVYVGRLGKDELAAMSFTFPVVFFLVGITIGIGMGATSIISRTLGAGDKKRAARLTLDGLILALVITIIATLTGLLTMEKLFRAMGAEEELFPLVKSYMTIWYLGMIMVVVPMVGNAMIRATGDTKTPMKIMLTAVVINLVLDPILIFGPGPIPELGLPGAAWATVIARAITMVLSLYILIFKKKLLIWIKPTLKSTISSWKAILHVGLPTALVNVLTPISQAIIISMVAGYGTMAVAGYGAATRLEAFIIMPIGAMCTAIIPFIGQNMGAGKIHRVKLSIQFGARAALIFGFTAFVIFSLFSSIIGRLFNSDPDVIHNFSLYVWFGGMSWASLGLCYLVSSSFNAMGKPMPGAVLTLMRVFILMIPLALLWSYFSGITGIFVAVSLANTIAAILSLIWINGTTSLRTGRASRQAKTMGANY